MSQHLSPTDVLRMIRDGPASRYRLTNHDVRSAIRSRPEQFDRALVRLNFSMLDKQYKSSGRDTLSEFERFVRPWRGAATTEGSEYFLGTVDAYSRALELGFQYLDWEDSKPAVELAAKFERSMPTSTSIAGIPWRLVLGQVQSTFSREAAAETFLDVRNHEYVSLVPSFYWDTGALTYFYDKEVQERRFILPSLAEMQSWQAGAGPRSESAIVVGMDPNFFRIYGPMVLFNAQQVPELDFVFLLLASPDEAQLLYENAQRYLAGLTALNVQPAPSNVCYRALNVPDWVENKVTFYASARFLAIPGLLKEYETVYSIDADLFMMRDPVPFLKSQEFTVIGFPKSKGLLGVPPWRRYMAGNFIASAGASDSILLQRHLDYLSAGLIESESWMLDQNALSYAVEGAASGEFKALPRIRPARSGPIMAKWENNYKAILD